MKNRVRRITITPVRVPVPHELVNCPEFGDQTLNVDEKGNWGGTWFGDVPFYVIRVEGNGGPCGWADTSRAIDLKQLVRIAQAFIGFELPDPSAPVVQLAEAVLTSAHERTVLEHPDDKDAPLVYFKGLETAVLDWIGRLTDRPLHALFGPQVRTGVRVEYWSGFRTPAAAARIARQAMAQGFKGLKLKAHLGIDAAGIAKSVADACGTGFDLNLDPNGRWETYENLIERARAIARVNANVLLEDPIYTSLDPAARTRRETGIRIASTVGKPKNLANVLTADAADAINVVGLWSDIQAIAAGAARAGLPCWLGSGCECGFSDLAAIHMASTLPACTLGSDLVAHRVRADDLLLQPIETIDGLARVPRGPGLGIDADRETIERFRIADPIVIE